MTKICNEKIVMKKRIFVWWKFVGDEKEEKKMMKKFFNDNYLWWRTFCGKKYCKKEKNNCTTNLWWQFLFWKQRHKLCHNWKCKKTQKLKLEQHSKTTFVTKLNNSNIEKTSKNRIVSKWRKKRKINCVTLKQIKLRPKSKLKLY